jgi:hypothetical protein
MLGWGERFVWVVALVLAALAAIPPATGLRPPPGVTVTIMRGEGDEWIADYRFDEPSRTWFFPRSGIGEDGTPWRPRVWSVDTPGVKMVRAGHYDVLTSAGGPMKRVRIRMSLDAEQPQGDYAPVLRFSDGAVAFFSGQFMLLPVGSVAAAGSLPIDLSRAGLNWTPVTLIVNDPGRRLMMRGAVTKNRVSFRVDEANTYIYTGDTQVIETPAFAGVIDPGLPPWVRREVSDFTPRLMKLYRDRLGPPAIGRPMALIAWGGDLAEVETLGGGVVDGMVVMQIGGARVREDLPLTRSWLRWFLGHESAHFWMGQTLRNERITQGWITEGTADFLATRALQQLAPEYDPRPVLGDAMDECLTLVGPREALARSRERGEPRANYSCGALLLLAVDSALKRRDPKADGFTFVRRLIDTNRDDGTIDTGEWIEQFRIATGNKALASEVRAFILIGVPDPEAFWRRLFAATGVTLPVERKPDKNISKTG